MTFTELATSWRAKADKSREVAQRILRTKGPATDAEAMLVLSAEMLDKCAEELLYEVRCGEIK